MNRILTILLLAPLCTAAMAASPVNQQVTSAVTQTNVKIVAEAPSMSVGLVYQTMGHYQ